MGDQCWQKRKNTLQRNTVKFYLSSSRMQLEYLHFRKGSVWVRGGGRRWEVVGGGWSREWGEGMKKYARSSKLNEKRQK